MLAWGGLFGGTPAQAASCTSNPHRTPRLRHTWPVIGRPVLVAACLTTALLVGACSSGSTATPRAAGGWQTAGHRDASALASSASGPAEGSTDTAAPAPTPSTTVGLQGTIVTGCQAKSHADCVDATIIGANWSGINLTAIDLTGATLLNVDLSRASLLRARLSGATIMNVDLTDANLRGADLSGATVVNSKLDVAFTGPRTTCPGGQPGPCQ